MGFIQNALGRHLSILSNDRRAREGIDGESEERYVSPSVCETTTTGKANSVFEISIRKKSRLLLGKKLLGS